MAISDFSIRRPVFAWMLMSAFIFFGLISFQRMGIGRLPDVDFPVISINLTWEGAAPAVMESDVVDPVEDAMTGIQGVKEIRSSVRQGSANVTLELELSRDNDVAGFSQLCDLIIGGVNSSGHRQAGDIKRLRGAHDFPGHQHQRNFYSFHRLV